MADFFSGKIHHVRASEECPAITPANGRQQLIIHSYKPDNPARAQEQKKICTKIKTTAIPVRVSSNYFPFHAVAPVHFLSPPTLQNFNLLCTFRIPLPVFMKRR